MLAMLHMREQELKSPEARASPAEDQNVNPGKSFPGQFAGKGQKEGLVGQ